MKVSVIILNWNGEALLKRYLPSVVEHTLCSKEVEVVVADNGSTDDSLRFLETNYPQVRILNLFENHGFAQGYNLALEHLDSQYAVLLNSDVEVTEGWLEPLIAYMDEDETVGACQPKIRALRARAHFEHAGASGGFMDALGYPFCRGRILQHVEADFGQYDNVVDVFWATGACLCVRTALYRNSGGLDKHFFAHMEEIDLCWRLRSRGIRVVVVPQSTIYHLGGATLQKENPHKTFLNYRNNLLMIYKNMPSNALFRILMLRFFLDHASALVFLLTGKPNDAIAVWRARLAFWKMRPLYRDLRKSNLAQHVLPIIPEMMKGSLLFMYYFRGIKTFDRLKRF